MYIFHSLLLQKFNVIFSNHIDWISEITFLPDSPRDTSVVISPTDPVSVGSVVNLTCSCRGNPAIVHFVWFMLSDTRLELIRVDTQVYGFKVTNGDQGRLFYCGCRNDLDIQLSTGLQLTFKGNCYNYGLWCFREVTCLEGDRAVVLQVVHSLNRLGSKLW